MEDKIMTEEEVTKIELEVKESPIEGKDGVARISDDVLAKIGAEEGHSIVVASESKELLITIYADQMIEPNKISLRPGDRKKLSVAGGDKVFLTPHKTVSESLHEKTDALKKKLDIGQDEEEEEKED
jgi:formylmethanofuran dehydrogenase subunit D